MKIKTQRILKYIPFVNLITTFFWIKACSNNNVEPKRFFKGLLLVMSLLIATFIPEMLIKKFCEVDIIDTVTHHVFTYLQLFLIAHVAVREQEKIQQDSQINTEDDNIEIT